MATSGPGATNLVTGIADAQIDSTPMVCITGQVADHLLGSDAFQETDIIGISTPVTKWNYQITRASEIPEIMAKAFYIARSGRPGPVLMILQKTLNLSSSTLPMKSARAYVLIDPFLPCKTTRAAAAACTAKKPMIVWGQGVILGEAEEEFKTLLKALGFLLFGQF